MPREELDLFDRCDALDQKLLQAALRISGVQGISVGIENPDHLVAEDGDELPLGPRP